MASILLGFCQVHFSHLGLLCVPAENNNMRYAADVKLGRLRSTFKWATFEGFTKQLTHSPSERMLILGSFTRAVNKRPRAFSRLERKNI